MEIAFRDIADRSRMNEIRKNELEHKLNVMVQQIQDIGRSLYLAGDWEGRNIQERLELEGEYYEVTGKKFDFSQKPQSEEEDQKQDLINFLVHNGFKKSFSKTIVQKLRLKGVESFSELTDDAIRLLELPGIRVSKWHKDELILARDQARNKMQSQGLIFGPHFNSSLNPYFVTI